MPTFETLMPEPTTPTMANGHAPDPAPRSCAVPDGSDAPLGAALATRKALLGLPAEVAIADWDVLLSAVKDRLRLTVGEWLAAPPPAAASVPAAPGRLQANLLECVAALDQLHVTFAHELDRRHRLELEVFDAKTALERARAELALQSSGQRHARHAGLHDSVTALPNRMLFRERLDAALVDRGVRRRPIAVIYLDLDGFAPISDAHGAETANELLRIVAARLMRSVRSEDLVSRLDGDEFALLLANVVDREQLGHLACKLFDAVSAPLKIGPLELTVRPNIGIAICPGEGEFNAALLDNAGAAMVRAKRHQTGYAFFDDGALASVPGLN